MSDELTHYERAEIAAGYPGTEHLPQPYKPDYHAEIARVRARTWEDVARLLREHLGQWVTCEAWTVAARDPVGCEFRVLGGRTVYEAAWCVCGPRGGERVELRRLGHVAGGGLTETVRRVRPAALVQVRRHELPRENNGEFHLTAEEAR